MSGSIFSRPERNPQVVGTAPALLALRQEGRGGSGDCEAEG
jgi:hypothetical protein